MLQQRLSRSLQIASRQPSAFHTFPNIATPASRLRLAPAVAQSRWYSENNTKEEATKETAEKKDAPKEDAAAPENPLKAELEKNKEQNKDLTV